MEMQLYLNETGGGGSDGDAAAPERNLFEFAPFRVEDCLVFVPSLAMFSQFAPSKLFKFWFTHGLYLVYTVCTEFTHSLY